MHKPGCVSIHGRFKSWRENQDQPILSARTMLWFWREYLARYEDSTDPRAAPLEATT